MGADQQSYAQTTSFVHGRHLPSTQTYANVDPSTGAVLGQVARAAGDEVDQAVDSARRAQREWRTSSPAQRSALLLSIADAVLGHREELAVLETQDTGKPLSQARADVEVAARYFRFYGQAVESYYGRTIPLGSDVHAYTRREPYGVTGHIVAWNYPLQLISRAVATSLATGNAAVAKPADETPRSTVRLAELIRGAGAPAGAFNVVTGLGAEAGAALAHHPGVDHLGFVGSTETGSAIAHAAAERVIPTVLELGGKSANIVFPDADLGGALPSLVRSVVQNAGQTCSAGSRLIVHRSVHGELMERLVEAFERIGIGAGIDDPDLGPLVSERQHERVSGFLAEVDPAQVLTGGRAPGSLEGRLAGGSYFLPTVVDGVDPESRIAQEEVFGPVVAVLAFDDEEEAISLANGTEYGLVSAVWTQHLGRAHRMVEAIEAGQVFVNTYGAGGGVELPFGGFKRSGYGREKGLEALDEYTQTKTVVMKF